MPPRLERRQQTGSLHFITFSCHARKPYLSSHRAASIFEYSLEAMRKKYGFKLLGYVVMPEHVHLLLSEPPTHPLSTVIGSLKRSVSKQLPQSPFWLPRYFDFNVFSEDKRIEKLRYIHRNPVTRGLVANPQDYPWSSFDSYARNARGHVHIDTGRDEPHDRRAASAASSIMGHPNLTHPQILSSGNPPQNPSNPLKPNH